MHDTPRKAFVSDRQDGRFVDTAGFVHAFIKSHRPKLAFDPEMDAREFPAWRERLRKKVLELMAFPEVVRQPAPKRVGVEQRAGYQLQCWEIYPEPHCVVSLSDAGPRWYERPVARAGGPVFPGLQRQQRRNGR